MGVAAKTTCPLCGGDEQIEGIYLSQVPAHTVVMCKTRDEAAASTTGEMYLVCCNTCGFVFNAAFDNNLLHYSRDYESTQSFSATFNAFNQEITRQICEAVAEHDSYIVEIGCGQGELLALLETRGCNRLIGFDPAFDAARSSLGKESSVVIHAERFSVEKADVPVGVIVCKMTLEHVADPVTLLTVIRRLAEKNPGCKVFIQVPNVSEVFASGSFWDVYYEHCNYFTRTTLERALALAGLVIDGMGTGFGNQYLMAWARSGNAGLQKAQKAEAENESEKFRRFSREIEKIVQYWQGWISGYGNTGGCVALWGGGSKAVALISFLTSHESVCCAIDINPRKSGTYLPGSSLPVVVPEKGLEFHPAVILLLNPNYLDEVTQTCAGIGLEAPIAVFGDKTNYKNLLND